MMQEEIRMVTAPLTLWEAALIKKLRKYKYGKVTITIQGGNPVYMSVHENKGISKEEGLELKNAVVIDPALPDPI